MTHKHKRRNGVTFACDCDEFDALAARLAVYEQDNAHHVARCYAAEARLAEAVAALHEIAHAHDTDARRLRLMAADALIQHNTADSADVAPCFHNFDNGGTCKLCGWPFERATVTVSLNPEQRK